MGKSELGQIAHAHTAQVAYFTKHASTLGPIRPVMPHPGKFFVASQKKSPRDATKIAAIS
jgi:hypothetical protein